MPETFPVWNAESQALEETEYFSMDEIAAMFHVSRSTIFTMADEGNWPRLVVKRRFYMTARDIGEALEGMRRTGISEADDADKRFGVPVLEDPFLVKPEDDTGGVQ